VTDRWWDSAPLAKARGSDNGADKWWTAAPLAGAMPAAPVAAVDAMGNPTGAPDIPAAPATMSYGDQMKRIGGLVDDGVRLLANGATFGMADRVAGAMDAATGEAPSYSAGVEAQRNRTQALRDAAPVTAGVMEAAGGIGTGIGLVKNGITLAGRVGMGLLPRTAAFGLEGAGYGAAAGIGNTFSEKPGDYLAAAKDGALTGGMVGTALPIAGAGISGLFRLAKPVATRPVEGVGRSGSTMLRVAAQADEAGMRELPALGPEAMLPDAGPSMLGLAQGAGTGIGPGKTALVGALRQRDAGVGQRLATAVDDALGPAVVPSRIEAEIRAGQRALSPDYEQGLSSARAVTPPRAADVPHWGFPLSSGAPRASAASGPNTQAVADAIDAQIVDARGPVRSALESARGMLNLYGTRELDPSPRALLETRKALDGMIGTAERSGDSAVVRALTDVRQQVDAVLDQSAPGVKAVDAQFAELARQRDALERGQSIFDIGRSTAIRPSELADEITTGALPQGRMVGPSAAPVRMRQGARAEVDRIVGTNVNDLNALERTLATPQDWNAQKVATVFGDEAYSELARALAGERQMRSTYQAVAQGSQTAQRQQAAQAMDGTAGPALDTTLTGAAATTLRTLARLLAGRSSEATKDQVAQVLASRGDAVRQIAEALLAEAATTGRQAQAIRGAIANPAYLGGASQPGGQR